MILYRGEILPSEKQDSIIKSIGGFTSAALFGEHASRGELLDAADALSALISEGKYDDDIRAFSEDELSYYRQTAARLLKRENIERRLKRELPELYSDNNAERITIGIYPLGVLFHIAAGNAEALPAYSVFEGLVTGNVNILKLPQADNGITVKLLSEFIRLCPKAADMITVFDTPSSDIEAVKRLSLAADGIVIWGSDAAVKAVRCSAPVNAKLIEWGHRLSFAYISEYDGCEKELAALARHIITTKQLLCSSCQTIFIDTVSLSEIKSFSERFLEVLEREAELCPINDIGAAAEQSVASYCARLERAVSGSGSNERGRRTLRGERCSVTVCADTRLELSDMYGNVLVKRLPREKAPMSLRRSKGLLQTAGLICRESERAELSRMLIMSGVNRVTRAGDMSESFDGEAHDGEYPLRRYVRYADTQL